MRHPLILLVSAAICATAALGQEAGVSSGPGPNGVFASARFAAPMPYFAPAIMGAPYAGEEVTEQVQTLADGTHITRKSPATKQYRDSLGRTRTERPVNGGLALSGRNPEADSLMWIEITDPVGRVKYVLDPTAKVAHRQQLPAPPPMSAPGPMPAKGIITNTVGTTSGMLGGMIAPPGTGAKPQISNEKLGTQTMEGVLVEGTRTTLVYPVDSQGNDRPISVVSERWMSPELKVMILSKNSDPRSGDHTQKLTNITVGEPPATLFQPPPEYTVVDESGPFNIKWGNRQ